MRNALKKKIELYPQILEVFLIKEVSHPHANR